MLDSALLVRSLETAIASLLMTELVDSGTVFGKDNDRHGKEEILHVRSLFQHERCQVIAEHPSLDIFVLGRFLRLIVHVLLPCPIASQHIEQLVLRHDFITANHLDYLKGQLVV